MIRPESAILVGKHSFQTTGAGGLVNLIVDRQQSAGCQLGLIVPAVGLDRERALPHVLSHVWQVVFGKRKEDSNRLDLGDNQQRIGVGCVHHVAYIDQTQSDPAAEGCSNVTVRQVQLRVVDLSLIRANRSLQLIRGCPLRVHLLLRDGT